MTPQVVITQNQKESGVVSVLGYCQNLKRLLFIITIFFIFGCDTKELGADYEKVDSDNPSSADGAVNPGGGPGGGAEAGGEGSDDSGEGSDDSGDGEDNKTKVEVIFADKVLNEGTPFSLAIVIPQTFTEAAKIKWSVNVESGKAKLAKKDFSEAEGEATIEVGSLSTLITLNPHQDFLREGDESFVLKLEDKAHFIDQSFVFTLVDGPVYQKGLVAAGTSHSCSISSNALYCWGANRAGQSGQGDMRRTVTATSLPSLNTEMSQVMTQSDHTCAIKDGGLYCWGRNNEGQLGIASRNRRRIPTPVNNLMDKVTQVATGNSHTCAIQDFSLKCWGENDAGELGTGNFDRAVVAADVLEMKKDVTDVALGRGHTCAIKAGALYCWGRNDYGQLGTGNTDSVEKATAVIGFEAGTELVVAFDFQTCAIKKGALYCWGDNGSGQLALGVAGGFYDKPEKTLLEKVDGVELGAEHGCAIAGGKPLCWGRGIEGQLGHSANLNIFDPTEIDPFGEQVISIAAGEFHTCMVGKTLTKCWGQGAAGELGDGNRSSTNRPVDVKFQ